MLDKDKKPETVLIIKVIFEVNDREKVVDSLNARSDFIVLKKRGHPATVILWLKKATGKGVTPDNKNLINPNDRLLGIITLSPKRLVLQCLGKARAFMGQKVLLKAAGKDLRYRLTTYQNLSSALKEKTAIKETILPEDMYPHLEPEFFKSYFEVHWVHEKIPALGGLTPLQCARSQRKKERDQLAALLATLKESPTNLYNFDHLISILGFKDHPLLCQDRIIKQKLKEEIAALVDYNMRFILAISRTGPDSASHNPGAVHKLMESNLILKGLTYLLKPKRQTQTELLKLKNLVEELKEIVQILQTEIISNLADKELFKELVEEPSWDHQTVITAETIDAVARAMEKDWRERVDQKPVRPDIPLATALNKIPAIWVTSIQENLGIPLKKTKRKNIEAIIEYISQPQRLNLVVKKLIPFAVSAVKALKTVYIQGGTYPYHKLAELFGTEEKDGYFWNKRSPVSPLGLLRAHGLLFIGQVKKEGKYYKMAVIPKEIRENLSFLRDIPL